MKNILLSLLCILSLQSMMMQAAAESKDDYQDKRQAIIDHLMQPENYIELKSGFALLQSQGLKAPSFHDVLEQNIPQSDDEDLDLHAITAQAEDILISNMTLNMKDQFIATLEITLKQNKALNQINDPIFEYVMQHKDDYMCDMVHSWLHEWNKTKKFGWTPLHEAAQNNRAEIVSMLLAVGADVNSKTHINKTPLHVAAKKNNSEVLGVLITAGADVNIQDHYGEAPLHNAVDKNNAEIVRMLINAGANVNIQNENGEAPLHNAATFSRAELARMLINVGANVNVQDKYGDTPLHEAAYRNSKEVARILIKAGANVNIQNNRGQTAVQLVHTYGMRAMFIPAICCTIS